MTVHPKQTSDHRTMLNVGCGGRFHPEWNNIDLVSSSSAVIEHDITAGLPFADNTFDVVYHSHVIEHLDRQAGQKLMRECHRVVKPGGIVRVVAPDLEYSCRLYLQSLEAALDPAQPEPAVAAEHYEWTLLNLIDQMVRTHSTGEMGAFLKRETFLDFEFVVNNGGGRLALDIRDAIAAVRRRPTIEPSPAFATRVIRSLRHRLKRQRKLPPIEQEVRFRATGEVHKWMYDRYSITDLFEVARLTDIQHLSAGESQVPGWISFHLDTDDDGFAHKSGSLFVEATKI